MTKERKTILRYSLSFKQKVVREIENEGLTISEARQRYGISGYSTINRWLIIFGKNDLLNRIVRVEMKGEKDRVKELQAEIKKLKMALADTTIEKHLLETLIDVANEHYHTDLKKNFGDQSSKKATRKKDAQ
jgi:transposase